MRRITTLIIRTFALMLLVVLYGCFVKKQNDIPHLFNHPKIDSLLHVIKTTEHSDVKGMKAAALQMADIKDNENAQIISAYYLIKSDYYAHTTPDVINRLEAIYPRIKTKDLEFIKLEIDLVLIFYYRHFDKNLIKSSARIKMVSAYILDSRYKLDLDILTYNLSGRIYFKWNDRLKELLDIIKKNENREWDFYLSDMYTNLAYSYAHLGKKEDAIRVLEFTLNNNLKYNFIDNACNNINDLVNWRRSIPLQLRAIDMSLKSGHTRNLGMYYRVLGHCYMEDTQDFEKASEVYFNAMKQDSLNKNKTTLGSDMACYAWALVKSNKSNFHKSLALYDAAFSLIDSTQKSTKKSVLERKGWMYLSLGDTVMSKKIEKIAFSPYYTIPDSISIAKDEKFRIDEFLLSNGLQLQKKNNEIKLLSLSNELNNTLIQKQRLAIGIFLLISFIVGAIIYFYRQRLSVLKEIKSKNTIIEKQNNELKNVLQQLTESNQNIELKNAIIREQNNELKKVVANLTESNTMLENFAQVAAHDIKAPLRTISSFSSILKKKFEPTISEQDLRLFDFITTGCKDLSNIINDLLNFSSVTQDLGQPEIVNIVKLVEVVELKLNTFLESKNAQIEIVTVLPNIVAHKNLIMQLLLNIISNSAKYGKTNQNNLIKIGHQDHSGKHCLFYISDSGIGIPSDKLTEVFQLFRKLHASSEFEGSGIGLATCKKIVNFYGGEIWLESELGEGTTIFFTLPLIMR